MSFSWVGVNGVGKTTTIGKLAHYLSAQDKEVLICALRYVSCRSRGPVGYLGTAIRGGYRQADSGSRSGRRALRCDCCSHGRDPKMSVITDTAGRLHSKINLMKELEEDDPRGLQGG